MDINSLKKGTTSKKPEPKEQKVEKTTTDKTTNSNEEYAREMVEDIVAGGIYWPKVYRLENVDIVKIVVTRSVFKGKKLNDDDGNPKFDFEFHTIDEDDIPCIIKGGLFSALSRELGNALRRYNHKWTKHELLLGLKINIECTNYLDVQKEKDDAYKFSADVVGEATHDVESKDIVYEDC